MPAPGPTLSCSPRTALYSNHYSSTAVPRYDFWYGPAALPAIASDITIETVINSSTDKGATIERSSSLGTNSPFRLFFVGANPANPNTSNYFTPGSGKLTLRNVTLKGGLAKGGDSSGNGGGGMGPGGAIFSQGEVTLDGVTITDNEARGGNSNLPDIGRAGGGIGTYASGDSGGGFGGSGFGGGTGGSGPGGRAAGAVSAPVRTAAVAAAMRAPTAVVNQVLAMGAT